MAIDVMIAAGVTTTEATDVADTIVVTTDTMIVVVAMTVETIEDTVVVMTEGMIGQDMDGATIREGEGITCSY